jgi:hypothetical protein
MNISHITCKQCHKKLELVPKNEHGFPLISEYYNCGNFADSGMGHQYVYTSDGKTALCIVKLREEV